MNECRQVTNMFATLNFSIKSVADNAFVDNKENAFKERALVQLFKNLNSNIGDTFRRWREHNRITNINKMMSN